MDDDRTKTPRLPSQERLTSPSPRANVPSLSEDNQDLPITVKIEPNTQVQEPLIGFDHATPFNLDADDAPAPPVAPVSFETFLRPGGLLPTPSQTSDNSNSKRSFGSMDRDEYPNQDGRYDPSNEPLPKTAIHHKNFSAAERIACGIPSEILQIISESGFADEDVLFLREGAENTRRITYPKSVKIGLRGDSGTGKSSLINSILGYDGIAPYGNDGEACTAVVQEFRKPELYQQTACESQIIFLSPEARRVTLKDWVQDYWDSQASAADSEDDDFVEAEMENQGASSTTVDALVSLFCDHEECKDTDAARKFLSTATVRGDPHIIGTLNSWMDSLLASRGVKGGHVTISAASPELLQYEVAPYIQHVNNGLPSPWPLVKLVRTYFDSPILSQDIILADLPGSSDINKTRMQASKVYITNDVEYTGVVAKIDRAQSDSATQQYLLDAYKRRRGPNVFTVATCSDSMNTSPAIVDKYINSANSTDAKDLSKLKDDINMVNLELESTKAKHNRTRAHKDWDAAEDLQKKMEDLEAAKASVKVRISEILIRLRNEKVAAGLRRRHLDLTKTELPVFCVSNTEYMIHLHGIGSQEQPPKMGVEATEIPKLRAHLYALPALRKFMAFNHHRKFKMPSLLNSIEMTCSQSKLKRRAELEKILIDAQAPILAEIERVFNTYLDAEVLGIIGKIKVAKAKNAYIVAAKRKLAAYSKWPAATQKVFCVHNGTWETKKVGKVDWNAEMMEALVKDMEVDLRRWDDLSSNLTKDLSELITGIARNLIAQLGDAAGPSRGVLKVFFDELNLQSDQLSTRCREAAESFDKGLCIVKDGILKHYFVEAMAETYKKSVGLSGPGVRQRRIELLEEKLSEKGTKNPFHEVHNKAKSAAQKLTQQCVGEFHGVVLHIFQSFHATFMRSFKTDEADSPEAKALRERLRSRLPAWRNMLTDIEHLIQECEESTKRI